MKHLNTLNKLYKPHMRPLKNSSKSMLDYVHTKLSGVFKPNDSMLVRLKSAVVLGIFKTLHAIRLPLIKNVFSVNYLFSSFEGIGEENLPPDSLEAIEELIEVQSEVISDVASNQHKFCLYAALIYCL